MNNKRVMGAAIPVTLDYVNINLPQALLNLSHSLDVSFRGVKKHHMRVALLSLQIGKAVGMDEQSLFRLFKGAIVHDIGAVKWEEKCNLERFDVNDTWDHCQRGSDFVEGIYFLDEVTEIIKYHHHRWDGKEGTVIRKDDIPLASRIIHLADRVDVLINDKMCILEQHENILKQVSSMAGIFFDPDLVAVLNTIGKVESLWIDMISPWIAERILGEIPSYNLNISIKVLSSFAELYARVVDSKSPFTNRHSHGVSLISQFLARQVGMNDNEIFLIHIAGLLHDIGKLAVPESIILKPGLLTKQERNIIKQHTYYTYWWVKPILPSLPLAEWAAYHHERLDGSGYPFHKEYYELDMGSRIVSIADKYTALREDRPYRQGLSWVQIKDFFEKEVLEGSIDGELLQVLLVNEKAVEELWCNL